jgi:class 3 adenylate cyclase
MSVLLQPVADEATRAKPEQAFQPFIQSCAGDLNQSWLELPNGRTYWCQSRTSVGRQFDNDLVLDTTTVSRRHALLTPYLGGYAITDLRSRNGTYVNGNPVTRLTLLHDRDEVRLGRVAMCYRCTRTDNFIESDTSSARTNSMDQIREHPCWLLLADIAGFSALSAKVGSRAALQHFQAWISGMRPLIERNGGRINSYVGDALLAWWPSDNTAPIRVRDAFAAIQHWRDKSPVPYRIVLHHGHVLFTRSERGDELGGQDVNLAFRAEKVAKRLGVAAMLSGAAVRSLQLEEQCHALGSSAVDGFARKIAFFAAPIQLAV